MVIHRNTRSLHINGLYWKHMINKEETIYTAIYMSMKGIIMLIENEGGG